jgi:hypothetical protein
MKRQLAIITTLLVFICSSSVGQDNSNLFSRLQAISNSGTDFFNVDGIEITSQSISSDFSKKSILKKFKKYSINENDLTSSDTLLNLANYYVSKTGEICPGTIQHASYYFIDNPGKGFTAITFVSFNKKDRNFERNFVKLLYTDSIPKTIYEPLQIDSINFAGRKIALGSSCKWMGINNVQCPSYGQMNWSVHKTLEDAISTVENQFNVINAKKGGKIVSVDTVNVIFESSETTAKKVIYDFKGVTSLLAGMSGGKTLTIYFVAAPVKQNFVSCIMSFWNNDSVNPGGLPPLLERVMKLRQ